MAFVGTLARRTGSIVAALIGAACVSTRAATCASPVSSDHAWCAVDRAPRLIVDSTTPRVRYPTIMRDANVAGEVLIDATVTDSGRIDVSTLRVRNSTHDIFTKAVVPAFDEWRFVPAQVRGKNVSTHATFAFVFGLGALSMPGEYVSGVPRSTPAGLEFRIRWQSISRDTNAQVDSARVYGMVESVARRYRATDGRATCLDWSPTGRGRPPTRLLESLRTAGAPFVAPPNCPPTYAQQIRPLAPPMARPLGALDPQIMKIEDVRAWRSDVFTFRISAWIGTSVDFAECQATWIATTASWDIYCPIWRHGIA